MFYLSPHYVFLWLTSNDISQEIQRIKSLIFPAIVDNINIPDNGHSFKLFLLKLNSEILKGSWVLTLSSETFVAQ